MSGAPTYECDPEFQKLLARRSDVDLTGAALEFARDAYPGLEFEPTFDWISQRAAELAGPVARAKSDRAALETLAQCLAEEHGLRGDPSHFEDPDASYLHRVIETGRGIPISLSAIYLAVAERLGIDLKGVAAPAHFLTLSETADGPLFVDPFHGGRILTRAETVQWLSGLSKMPRRDIAATLHAASPRAVLTRMLNNLKMLYARREQWGPAWKVQHRLTALQPASYQERRDLAILSVRAQHAGPGLDLLQACLQECPEDDRETLEQMRNEARNQLARWN